MSPYPKCLVNGRHTAEDAAAECPLLGRSKQQRIESWRRQQEEERARAEER